MKRLFILFALLLTHSALSQSLNVGTATFGASPAAWSPTNNSDGYSPYLWLVGDYATTNTGGGRVADWPDATTNSLNFITNGVNHLAPFYTNSVNGHMAVSFVHGLSNALQNTDYRMATQPGEWWFVVYQPVVNDRVHYFFDTDGPEFLSHWNVSKYMITAGTALAGVDSTAIAGQWLVLSCLFNGASSEIRTNNVLYASGDAGTGAALSMGLIGKDGGAANYASYSMAESLHFTNNLSATYRSNLTYYLSAKYTITNSFYP